MDSSNSPYLDFVVTIPILIVQQQHKMHWVPNMTTINKLRLNCRVLSYQLDGCLAGTVTDCLSLVNLGHG